MSSSLYWEDIPDIHSSHPRAPYMRRWTGTSLVQVMACRLLGAKPLPEPMPAYSQLDLWKQISAKFESKLCHFHWTDNTNMTFSTACVLPGWLSAGWHNLCNSSWGSFHQIYQHRQSNFTDMSFGSHQNSNKGIATKFCTRNDICTVVTCGHILAIRFAKM